MLEVQVDVTPAGATVNATERKPDGTENDLDAKDDEGDKFEVKHDQDTDSAAAKADESQEETNATKADDKEDASVNAAAKDQENEDAAKTVSQETPAPVGVAGT